MMKKKKLAATAGSTQTMVTMACAREDWSMGGTDSMGDSEQPLRVGTQPSPFHPAISLLGVQPTEMKTQLHTETPKCINKHHS